MNQNPTKEEVLSALWFDMDKTVAIDIETSNINTLRGELDPWKEGSCIALVQTCIDGVITLHDWGAEVIDLIVKYRDLGYTFMGHNLSFELNWLRVHAGIELPLIVDTMILSQLLNAGKLLPDEGTRVALRADGINIDHLGKYDLLVEEDVDNIENTRSAGRLAHNLGAVAYRYAHVKLNKDSANSNWLRRPLTNEQIRYAEDDVRYIHQIVKNQCYFGYKLGLLRVFELECRTTPALADMSYNGLRLSRERWEEAAHENSVKASALKEELDKAYGVEMGERETDLQEEYDFFGPVQKSFNVGSDTQLKKFHNIEKADEAHLQQVMHPLIRKTLEFKVFKKLASTYGEGYLQFMKSDERIHSALTQAKTSTGRLSSNEPNMQNIPGDILKSFIQSRKGYLLMTADYSSVESRILAYDAKDSIFIATVNAKDLHWETAKKIFKLPEDAPIDSEMRSFAKSVNFGIPYGISAGGLFNRGVGENKEAAQAIIDSWFAAFPKVKEYLATCIKEATVRGYTQDRIGRIRWYEIPAIQDVEEDVYKSALASAARQGQNMKIQALSASVTKQAILDCWTYLRETQYGYCVLTVHDSIFFELKEEHVVEAALALKEIMEYAGKKIIPEIITPVDFDLGIVEKRKCKVSGLAFKTYSHVYDKETNTIKLNDECISPVTRKCLKDLGIKLNDDYIGMYSDSLAKLETMEVKWLEDNKKWVNSITQLEAQSMSA